MNPQKFVLTAVVGGDVSFALGGLIYAVLLADFFARNMTAAGAMKAEPLYHAIAISELAAASLLTLIIGGWAKVTSAGEGAKLGAVFGLLTATMFDFNMYGTMSIVTMTAVLADIGLFIVRFGIVGGVIGAMVARKS